MRNFGCSEGLFASLNCGLGSGDDLARVHENRQRIASHFGMKGTQLVTAYQTHSANALVLNEPWASDARKEADALVTSTPGLLLGVLTADCAPVLLADPKAGVIAAAHAGWKGALDGILESTVGRMQELGAKIPCIRAAIGPCIAQDSYEVGPEFVERIADARFFTPADAAGKSCFDLGGYVRHRLNTIGITDISAVAADTCAEESRFFSYRRATLRGEGTYGRQISCIALKA